MTEIEKIENFLNDWENKNGSVENSYNEYISILPNEEDETSISDEISFELELGKFFDTLKNITNFEITYVGGFDSCGYSISCNVLTFLYKGKIHIYPINYESL